MDGMLMPSGMDAVRWRPAPSQFKGVSGKTAQDALPRTNPQKIRQAHLRNG